MNQVYVAINGDDVGSAIGSAIASDDRDALSNKSGKVKDIHSQIDQWVESMGGEVVTSAGDEGIYVMPEEALQHLEDLREKYAGYTGHTLTIGVGNSMSEATKALIYGKVTDKNKIVEYQPEIEQEISGMEEDTGTTGYDRQYEGSLPAEEDVQYQRDISAEEEAGMSPEEPEFDGEDEGTPEEDLDAEEVVSEAAGDDEMDGDETPEHEEGMSPEEEAIHDAAENEADELDEDIIEADEEAEGEGIDGEDYMEAPEGEEEITEDEFQEGAEGDDDEAALTDMIYSQMEGEDEVPQEGMEEDMEGEMPPEEEMMDEEMVGEEPLPEEPMPEEEMGPEEEMPEEMMEENDPEKEELKNEIATSLMTFKKYRDVILQSQQQAPEFYQAMITMLRSMIEMAKKLNMSPEQDAMQQENMDAMQQEMPVAGAAEAQAGGEAMMMSEKMEGKKLKKK